MEHIRIDTLLYKHRHLCRRLIYIECGDGWYDLLDELFTKLQRIIDKLPHSEEYFLKGVKQKFGRLRVDIERGLEDEPEGVKLGIEGPILMAEEKSSKICEVCGKPGQLRVNRGWHYTSCGEHIEPTVIA